MNAIIAIFGLLVFSKLFLFWLWLWQLKEYHTGRFLAHFEAQAAKKIASSLWRKRFPKFTKKIIVIFLAGLCLASYVTALNYAYIFLLIVFAPLFSSFLVGLFQVPTIVWRNSVIEKAKEKRKGFKNLLVVGITGSYGKTSTKEFLAAILSEKFKVCKTKEHQNSEIGISRCILEDLKPEHEVFIVEMGAYNRGGIKLLCDIVKPKMGILTGINEQHLATFGSLENIAKAKYELIESLPEDGTAFFNAKNKYCLDLYQKTGIKKLLYAEGVGSAGMENLEGAKAVAKELGMADEEISVACNKVENKFGGIKIKKGINGLIVIDATYSANPDGVLAHLEYLKSFSGKKAMIMPCLIELGSASKEIHRKIGEKISEACDLAIITTKDRFKEIKEGAGEKAVLIENPKEIFEKIKTFCKEGDVVLLESRVQTKLIKDLTTIK